MSGNLLSAVFDPCTITVGSSGALYGLLGALIPFSIGETLGIFSRARSFGITAYHISKALFCGLHTGIVSMD